MKRRRICIAVLAGLAVGGALLLADDSTNGPTTRPSGPEIEKRADAIVKLWPIDPPATQPGDQETIGGKVNQFGESDRTIRHVIVPTLTLFKPAHPNAAKTAIVVCAGGGYGGEVIDREGYYIADWLNQLGVTAIVLKYRLPYGVPPGEGSQPPPVQDVQRALRLVRAHAQEWDIDAKHVGIMGFSAGGHLAGTAATQFDAGDAGASDSVAQQSCRPDFAVLVYPVASMRDGFAHLGSRKALIGVDAGDALQHRYSTDEQVSAQTPPLLVVHAKDDKVVKVENSERIAAAAQKAGVDCTLVLFETGGHGFGLGLHAAEAGVWRERCRAWMEEKGFLRP